MDGCWLVVGMHEKLLTPPSEPARLDTDLPVNLVNSVNCPYHLSLSSSPRHSSSNPSSSPASLVRTLFLLPLRFQFGPFFFPPRDSSPDPSSSSPDIIVQTLLLLLPRFQSRPFFFFSRDSSSDPSSSSARCKFRLFFFYPRDSSSDPSSSSSSSNLSLSEPDTETKNPSLIYISVSPTHHSIHQQHHHEVVFPFPKFSFKASISV